MSKNFISFIAALYVVLRPHWVGFRYDCCGRAHIIPTDFYGRPRRR